MSGIKEKNGVELKIPDTARCCRRNLGKVVKKKEKKQTGGKIN